LHAAIDRLRYIHDNNANIFFFDMYLKTVKHLLMLFSSRQAGQFEISPSIKRAIFMHRKVTDKQVFFKYKVRKRRKACWKKKLNQMRNLFVGPVTYCSNKCTT